MYTIRQASELIGVSRQAIYSKLERLELQTYLQDTEQGKMILKEGIDVLKSLFTRLDSQPNNQSDSNPDSKITDKFTDNSQLINSYFDSLKSEIEHLKKVIENKDIQINELHDHLRNKDKLFENMQILLKDNSQKILQLEEKTCNNLWNRLFRKN